MKKFNNLTAAEVTERYERDRRKLLYRYERMIKHVVRHRLRTYSETWHDDEGYLYCLVIAERPDGRGYNCFAYGFAGVEGRERFINVSAFPEHPEMMMVCYTYHFLERYYKRAMQRLIGFTPFKALEHLSLNLGNLKIWEDGTESIYIMSRGLVFCTADTSTNILMAKTFVSLDMLRDNQREAYLLVKDLLQRVSIVFQHTEAQKRSNLFYACCQLIGCEVKKLHPYIAEILDIAKKSEKENE